MIHENYILIFGVIITLIGAIIHPIPLVIGTLLSEFGMGIVGISLGIYIQKEEAK